jgi:hypothetical protein
MTFNTRFIHRAAARLFEAISPVIRAANWHCSMVSLALRD